MKKILLPFLLLNIMFIILSCNAVSQTKPSLEKANHLCFIENRGQWDSEVLYLAKIKGMNAWITKSGVVYDYYQMKRDSSYKSDFSNPKDVPHYGIKGHVVKMQFDNNVQNLSIQNMGMDKLETYYNYFLGNDSTKWASFVPLYKEVSIDNIYKGIAVKYYFEDESSQNKGFRYDYIVSPRSDISQIKMKFEGQNKVYINENSELVIQTSIGEIIHQKLFAYQVEKNGNNKKQIQCRFIQNADGTIGFKVDNYNKDLELIIDPLVWSTYLGGNNYDTIINLCVLNDNSIIVVGGTSSTDYPFTLGAYDITPPNNYYYPDAIITKFNSSGSSIVFSTFLGGNTQTEYIYGISLDLTGNIYVSGWTSSTDFPVTLNCYQSNLRGTQDAFVTKLNSSCSSLIYSTYIGSSGIDNCNDIKVDNSGNAYITGTTLAADFPTTTGAFQTISQYMHGYNDAYVTKINPTGTGLVYSTYLCGRSEDDARKLCLDNSNNVIIAGWTNSSNFPITTGVIQTSLNGGNRDGFITKLNSTGTNVIFSTYLGGSLDDYLYDLTVDNSDNIYIAGWTSSTNFPCAGNSNTIYGGNYDCFFCKINSSATTLIYSSILGSSGNDYYPQIALDNSNNAVISMFTNSINLYTTSNAIQTNNAGDCDIYIAKFDFLSPTPIYATYLGGTLQDSNTGMGVDNQDNIIVAGHTLSTDYPTTPGCYKNYKSNDGGDYDNNITKISLINCDNITATPSSASYGNRTCLTDSTIIITLTNTGSSTVSVTGTSFYMGTSTKLNVANGGAFVLNGGGTRQLSITIKSDATGTIQDTLLVVYPTGCNNPLKIPISGIRDTISILVNSKDTIDFGRTCKNTVIDTVIHIQNKSSRATQFSRTAISSPFSITGTDPFASIFGLDETKDLHIRFSNADTGTFYQNLIITDTCGKTKTIVLKAMIYHPIIELGNDQGICLKDTIVIGNTATLGVPPYTYSWTPSTGLSSTITSTTKASPTVTTTYYLTVTDNIGCSNIDSIKITVSQLKISLGADQTICQKDSAIIGNNATNGIPPYIYSWTPTIGLSNPSASITKASPDITTIYYLTVTDNSGCSVTDSITLAVNSLPNTILKGKTSVCENQSYIYTITPKGASNDWTITGATSVDSSKKDTLTIIWGKSGVGKIKVIQSLATGCKDSVIINVTINPMPTPNIVGSSTVCDNTLQTYFTTQTGAINNWIVTGGTIIGNFDSDTIRVNWTNSGTAHIKLIQSYLSGCKDSIEKDIKVNPSPIISMADNVFICLDSTYTLDPVVSSGTKPWNKIEWTPTAGLSNSNILNPLVNISVAGSYKYILTITDANGCVGKDSITINVHTQPNLLLSKTLIDLGTLEPCQSSKDDSLEITNSGTDNIMVEEYDFNSGFSVVSPPIPFLLKPGEKQTIVIRYIASSVGQVTSDLYIKGSPCGWISSVQCKANKSEMMISSNIPVVNFGQDLSCLSIKKDTVIVLKNASTSNITIYFGDITLISPFSLIYPKVSRVIAPNDTVQVSIHYEPTVSGNYSEDIKIPFESVACKDTLKLSLLGAYTKPEMSSTLRNIVFPDIFGCDVSKDTTISIQNTGTIDAVIVSLEPTSVFSTSQTNATIPAGEKIDLKITFKPDVIGSYSGTLVIRFDPCGITDTVIVSGNRQGVDFVISDSLDFGEMIFCKDESQSKTLTLTIENKSSVGIDGLVKSLIQISEPFTTTLQAGDSLLNGQLNTYEVKLVVDSIMADGDISGILEFVLSPCDSVKFVKLHAKKSSAKLSNTLILDFGSVNIGASKIDTVIIQNTGTADASIGSINNIVLPFELITTIPTLPAILKPGEELKVAIKYTPNDSINDSLMITQISSYPCNISLYTILKGTGYKIDSTINCKIYIESANSATGQEVNLPLKLKSSENLIQTGVEKKFTAKIRYNSTLLVPHFAFDKDSSANDERIISISGSISTSVGTMKDMNFMACLGNSKCTDIIIDTVVWINSVVNIEKEDGQFCLTNICTDGGNRLINPNSRVALTKVAPNPAESELDIDFSLTEKGNTEICIYNVLGEKVKILFAEYVEQYDKRTIKCNISELASGQYLLIFKTPSYLETEKLQIIK